MPTAYRQGPYRFFFYSGDRPEPPHIHVASGSSEAKFWLEPVALEKWVGYDPRELRAIEVLVRQHRRRLLKAWDDFFEH